MVAIVSISFSTIRSRCSVAISFSNVRVSPLLSGLSAVASPLSIAAKSFWSASISARKALRSSSSLTASPRSALAFSTPACFLLCLMMAVRSTIFFLSLF